MVEDTRGATQLYFLPGALTEERQVSPLNHMRLICRGNIQQAFVMGSAGALGPALARHPPRGAPGAPATTEQWRVAERLFLEEQKCIELGRGTLNGSPAWQTQGHTVSVTAAWHVRL